VKSREPLDLTEVQGRYNNIFSKGSKLRRGRTVDLSHEDHQIYTWNHASGFCRFKSRNYCNRNHKIVKCDNPTARIFCVGPQWKSTSGQVAQYIKVSW
jgi:hypothetical protein